MTRQDYIFTSESVSEGHPDKVCDRISDSILDAFLAEEPEARVACETFATTNRVVIGGEVGLSDQKKLAQYMERVPDIVRAAIKDIGYEQDKFHWNTLEVTNLLHEQSAHIAQGVDDAYENRVASSADPLDLQGAGDQGLMFGYACKETDSLMPLPIDLSHRLVKKQADVMKSGEIKWLRPDAKSQVSVIYSDDGKTIEGLSAVVLSTQHDEDVTQEEIKAISERTIAFDHLVREYIHANLSYRFVLTHDGEEAINLEREARSGSLGSLPFLNPLLNRSI